jgi:hypothetical protein
MTWREARWVRFSLAAVVYAIAVSAALARVGLLGYARNLRLSAHWVMTDFYSAAYYPVQALLRGDNPHNAEQFVRLYPVADSYPPYAPSNLLFHLPFALLPPVPAAVGYFVLTLLLALPLAYMALRLAGVEATKPRVLLLAGLVFLSRPGHWTLLLGQMSVLLTCATYFVLLYAFRFPALSGLAVLLTISKPTFGVPLLLLLWAWRRRRAVAIGVVTAALLNLPLVGILAEREGGVRRFFQVLIAGYAAWQALPTATPEISTDRVDATSLVSRFLGTPLGAPGQALLAIAIILGACAVLRLLVRHRDQPAQDLAVGIICITPILIGFHRGYDLVLLTAPFVTAVARGLPMQNGRALRGVFLTLFIIPAVNWLATDAVLHAWHPSHAVWLVICSINSVCLALLFLGYLRLGLLYHLRTPWVEGAPSPTPLEQGGGVPA